MVELILWTFLVIVVSYILALAVFAFWVFVANPFARWWSRIPLVIVGGPIIWLLFGLFLCMVCVCEAELKASQRQ